MKTEMPKTLAIDGKVISIEKIGEKTQAQFAAQLKQNGIVLTEDRLKSVYDTFHGLAQEQNNEEDVQEVVEVQADVKQTNTEE